MAIPRPDTRDLPKSFIPWLYSFLTRVHHTVIYDATINPAAVSANTTSEQTFTVNGLNTTDILVVNKPSHNAGLGIVNARVSAANTLALTFMNTTGFSINPGEEVYRIVAFKRQ